MSHAAFLYQNLGNSDQNRKTAGSIHAETVRTYNFFQSKFSSNAYANLYIVSSSQNFPTNCAAAGNFTSSSPSSEGKNPTGILSAGCPVISKVQVFPVIEYAFAPASMLSEGSLRATLWTVGRRRASTVERARLYAPRTRRARFVALPRMVGWDSHRYFPLR